MKKLLVILPLAASLIGCANLNKAAFNAENLAADTGMGAVSSYNAYYRVSTNGASADNIRNLGANRASVYDASRKLSISLQTAEKLRQTYEISASTTNKVALTIALEVLSQNVSNIVVTVKTIQK